MLGSSPKSSSYMAISNRIVNRLRRSRSGARLRAVSNKLKSIVGARVKAARKSSNLTQARVAEAVDRTVEAISNIERGRSLPPLGLLERIAELTGCPLSSLVEAPSGDGTVSERAGLEMQLSAAGRSLPIDQLRIAVRQIDALGNRDS